MLLDGVEAMLLANWIYERNFGRVRPNLREQIQINCIDSLRVLIDQNVDSSYISRRSRVRLRSGADAEQRENCGK